MNQDIFLSTKNFTFTDEDSKAAVKIQQMIKQARSHMPDEFYTVYNLMYEDQARKTRLFKQMKTIPKGCMHHLHLDCTEDQDFYREYIINDPIVYLTSDREQFRVGTKEEAAKQKWIPIAEARKAYKTEDEFVKAVSNITMFNKEEMKKYTGNQKEIWDAFEVKICNFFPIYFALHIFRKYLKHVLIKYAKNGYDRVQFRAMLCKFNEYDRNGKMIKEHEQKHFMDTVDEILADVKKQFPRFTVGFIFFGLKVFSDEQNEAVFSKVCDLNWDKTVGLDFVQQEDVYGDLESYDKVIDRVLAKYPHLNYKKVYHAGQTRDHLTKNIEIAIKAGSVRIGHGLNILQRPEYLAYCKHICFEKNPVSNLVLGYQTDTRLSSAPVLLGLGYPITINPDDPGKFGLEDNTMDYFIAACSYPWGLKHLKLIAIHSINHAICSEVDRANLLHAFTIRWDKWIHNLIKEDQILTNPFIEDLAIFSAVRNWSFNDREMEAERKFSDLINDTRELLPKNFYHNDKFLLCLNEMKNTPLYSFLKNIPKSVLQHNHFQCNEDFDFYKNYVVSDPNLYLNKEKTQFQYGTHKEAAQKEWIALSELRKNFASEDEFVQAVSSISIFSEVELKELSGKEKLIWSKFQDKMDNFVPILLNLKFFKSYVKHVFMKFINNNYDRIELRAKIEKLNEYDAKGNFVKQHEYKKYIEIVDEVLKEVQKEYPNFTVGFIFAGLKALSDEENEHMFDEICKLEWKNTLGFDFVQEEALYGSLAKYNAVVDKVLKKYPHLDYKKVYHAGESKDQTNKNLEIAIQSGSVRIGDGINSLQRIEFLAHKKYVCFEQNPTTNLLLGYSGDSRNASTPVLLGLGFPVTINADDPGKFRLEDATSDYFMAAVSYKWRLRHFKLIALHAFNYSICPNGQKLILQELFETKWKNWIENFIRAQIY